MINLEYQLRVLDIDPHSFKLSEKEDRRRLEDFTKLGSGYRYIARHLFITHLLNNTLSIYISGQCRHSHVAGQFNLPDESIVGGGNCYMDNEGILILDDFSGDYGAIPKNVAQRFAELIKPKLRELGLDIKDISANPNESKLHSFWKTL